MPLSPGFEDAAQLATAWHRRRENPSMGLRMSALNLLTFLPPRHLESYAYWPTVLLQNFTSKDECHKFETELWHWTDFL